MVRGIKLRIDKETIPILDPLRMVVPIVSWIKREHASNLKKT